MTNERLKELREASQWLNRPIDGNIVHELVKEIIRLRATFDAANSEVIQNQKRPEIEIVRLTQEIESIPDEAVMLEPKEIYEYPQSDEVLDKQLSDIDRQFQQAIQVMRFHEKRFDELKTLLFMCADITKEPQAGAIILKTLSADILEGLDFYFCFGFAKTTWKYIDEHWVQITAIQLRKIVENMPHRVYSRSDGDHFYLESNGSRFAVKLLDGRNYVLPNFISEHLRYKCNL